MLALVNWGGTFDSATGGTFQSDTGGTFKVSQSFYQHGLYVELRFMEICCNYGRIY